MHWGERIGRVSLLGVILILAWLGQGLLQSNPPQLLNGGVILLLAVVAFTSLTVSARNTHIGRQSKHWSRYIDLLAAHAPQSFVLLALGVICGALAYVLDANPLLSPLFSLTAWAAGIGLFLLGTWQLQLRWPSPAPLGWDDPPGSPAEVAPDAAAPAEELAPAAEAEPPEEAAPPPEARTPAPRAAMPRAADGPLVGVLAGPYLRWELAALLALTVLALLARVMMLEHIPQNFSGDEGEMGMMARLVLSGEIRSPFATGWLSHPTLWFFMQAFSLSAFGNNIFGLRMLSALIGTATVPALYLLARLSFGRAIALAATLILALYHYHIHFSRLGVNNIMDPLVAVLTLTAFFYGYRTRSYVAFAAAGVSVGVGQHFYMGGRLMPIILAVLVLHQLLLNRRWIWSLRWHFVLMAVGFFLGFGPLLLFFATHPENFTARLAVVGIFQTGWYSQQRAAGVSALAIFAQQARDAFGAYIFQPDRSAWYDPKIPLLDQASAVLFLFGLGFAAIRWRRMETFVLLVWVVGAAMFGGMMLMNSPETPRYMTTAPVLCLLVALGIAQVSLMIRWALSLNQRAVWVCGGVIAVLLALWSANFYFRDYTPRRTFGWQNTELATEVGAYLETLPSDSYVYFLGPPRMYFGYGTIHFMAPTASGIDLNDPLTSPDALPALPPDHHPVFIALPERSAEIGVIQQRYPDGATRQIAAHDGSPLFSIYELK